MSRLHHLHSRYARLTPEAIDFSLEHVRDADEVLFGSEGLGARDMVRVARAVMETERLFERDPGALLEPQTAGFSDWTLACVAEALGDGSAMLNQRGSRTGAERARADQRSALRRIVESPRRSPLVAYDAVVSALLYDLPPASATELFELRCLALAEDLRKDAQSRFLSRICDIADAYLRLGREAAALCVYLGVLQFDPTDARAHWQLAASVRGRFASLAHAAASRALLLLPRVDEHSLRPQLRLIIEESNSAQPEPLKGLAAELHRMLQAPPGKRSRGSLRGLCQQLIPELAELPEKAPEPLPDSATLAQLRLDLKTLPRPRPELSSPVPASATRPAIGAVAPTAGVVDPARAKVGRNEPCPCGSDKKWKRCCGAR